ncbi:MAG: DsrE family protein [Promethearchaeota archaeon]
MVKKIALFAFNGDPMCFVHVLLNALDMKEQGYDVKVVIEGSATKLVKVYAEEKEKNPFYKLYVNLKERGLIDAVCKACATKMGAKEAAEAEGLPLSSTINGHPAMSTYIQKGYQIITF